MHLKHESGADVIAIANSDMYGGFGILNLVGTDGHAISRMADTYYAFKAQLESFVSYLATGERPFPFEETIELMKLVIGGIVSREQNGREIHLTEIKER